MTDFIVTHETIVLDTNFEKCQLSGFVELTVSLQKEYFYIQQSNHDTNFNRISINLPVIESDSFIIHEVTVDGHSAKYEQRQPYLRRINNNFSHITDLHSFETLFLSNVADVMDYGQLMINIPSALLSEHIPSLSHHNSSFVSHEALHKKRKLSNEHNVHKTDWNQSLLEPLIIKIAFTAKEPMDGIHFVVPRNINGSPSTTPSASTTDSNSRENSPCKSSAHKPKIRARCFGEMEYCEAMDEQKKNEIMYPHRKCHMFSYNAHWIPCLSRLHHRCSYTLQLSVPMNYTAICSGDLKVSKSNASCSKSTFIYDINHAISAHNLMFAVGPFEEIVLNDVLPECATVLTPGMMNMHHMDIDDDDDEEEEEEDDDDEDMIHKEKIYSTDSEEIDKEEESDDSVCIKLYVLSTHATDDILATCFNIERILKVYSNYLESSFPFKTLSFVFVDEAYETASAYLNLNILSTDLIHNEVEIEASYATNDILSRCIADNWMNYALDVSHIEDVWIKIGFAGLLHEQWLSIFEGQNEIEYRKAIWRNHREENGLHPHQAPQPPLSWNGYLHERQLYCTYYPFIKQKSMFVMIMLQQLIGSQSFKRNVTNHILFTPQTQDNLKKKFVSEFGTKITTETLEDHLCGIYSEKQIRTFFRHFILGDCCPKICAEYKLLTKEKRHVLLIKQEESHDAYCHAIGTLKIQIQELEHELIEYVEIPAAGDETMKFEFVCQSRAKRKHKNGENEPWQEAPANNDTAVKLIRIDPDYEMLLHLVFFIVEAKIAITQLLHDDIRDVKSQIEAIYSLRFVPSKETSLALLQTLNDEMNFYKVRLEAAKALAEDRNPETLHENKTELMNVIKKLWHNMTHMKYEQTNANKEDQVVNYLLIKHIVEYLSSLSQHKYPHHTPIEVVELILSLLKQLIDDNLSEFPFCTQRLTACMIENLGNIRVSDQKHNKLDEIVDILSQILSLQRLFQSAAGIVRCACLKTFAKLHLNHKYHRKLDEIVTRKIKPFAKYGKFHDNVRLTAFEIMVTLICDCKSKNIKRCLNIIANERVPRIKLKMINIWTQNNINTDYFNNYQNIAKGLHSDIKMQSSLAQSAASSLEATAENAYDEQQKDEENQEEREEKLDAINLRPTLRGSTKLAASHFLNNVLREKTPLNQVFVAQTIWNLLLKSLDKRQYENYQMDESQMQMIINDDQIAIRSIDLIFASYNLYKSIWAFDEPPFLKQKGVTLYANDIGNQKRVHDAVQKLKARFNNNRPMFCSFGAQFWRCT